MKKLAVDLQYCYGIKRLLHEFDYSKSQAIAIYAPNGVMKSSLARTFDDIANETATSDVVFKERVTKRRIENEKGEAISKENILVVHPFDSEYERSEHTSTLLVNSKLRLQYEQVISALKKKKEQFLKAFRKQSQNSRKDWELELASIFSRDKSEFFELLISLQAAVEESDETPFGNIKYDTVFKEEAIKFIQTQATKGLIEEYVRRYDELITKSKYFRKGVFNYYNADDTAKSLKKNGYFDAKHALKLNSTTPIEIESVEDFSDLIARERAEIFSDPGLKERFELLDKSLNANVGLRDFRDYLIENADILPFLGDIESFKKQVAISFLRAVRTQFIDLIETYTEAKSEIKGIESVAAEEKTEWQRVIDIFNERFSVPFELEARNHISLVLGREAALELIFRFYDTGDSREIEEGSLLKILSQGEKKALYLLNVIFEIEIRRLNGTETLIVFDDIADSFDYKNKYAIVEYMNDLKDVPAFKQLILTHNFDFFRTIEDRVVLYKDCLMTLRKTEGLELKKAVGIKNIFVKQWKPLFHKDSKVMIASIPFMRNLIEYTKGPSDKSYVCLTSILHWRSETSSITKSQLCQIFNELFSSSQEVSDPNRPITELIMTCANDCELEPESINFENKIVLSIAIRIYAEKYMVSKINDNVFVSNIRSNQTRKLYNKYIEEFGNSNDHARTLHRVVLMTPENLHLNAFMYEPIIDMSDDQLRQLWREVKSLCQ